LSDVTLANASGARLNLNGSSETIGSLSGGSLSSVLLGSGMLTVGDTVNTTYSGTISGTGGSLVKQGTDTLVLNRTNSYTGGTTVNAGVLRAGTVNAFVPNTAYVVNGGTLDTNGFSVIMSSLSGTGGTVSIGNTALNINSSGTTVYSGVITGSAGSTVNITTSGSQEFAGVSTSYLGATTINGGTLLVSGSIANSATTVNAGGTLAGAGTVGAVTVNSGAVLAPGPAGAPGTMTVSGSLVFAAGGTYLVNVTPSAASAASVNGTATLTGASVQTVFAPGSYVTRSSTILTSTGLIGTFTGGLTGNAPAGLNETLNYVGNNVLLDLTAQLGAVDTTGLSGNQQKLASTLNAYFNNGGTLPPGFVTVFGLTGSNLGTALSQLTGQAATGAQSSAFRMLTDFLGLTMDPNVDGRGGAAGSATGFAAEDEPLPPEIASAYAAVFKAPPKPIPFEQRWNLWGSAYGGYNRTASDANAGTADVTARAGGFAAGADYRLSPSTIVGFALAGGETSWQLAQGLGGGSGNAFQAGVYGKTRSGPIYIAASLAYAQHWMSTDRVAFAFDRLTTKFNAESYGGRIETGYRYLFPMVAVTPYAAFQGQAFTLPTRSESDPSNGGFGLTFAAQTTSDLRGETGARFDRLMALDATTILALRGKLAYAHDWVSDPTAAATFQALPGASFIVNGAAPPRNSGLASVGAEVRFANGIAVGAKFDGEFAAASQTYAGTGTLRYVW
jgi:autotransporter-associated beta strand protein